jgi:hypothetical protein
MKSIASLRVFLADLQNIDVPLPKLNSSLTNMLAGLLTNREKSVSVAHIAHVNLTESHFEEALLTLQLQESFKKAAQVEIHFRDTLEGSYQEHLEAVTKLLRRAEKENEALKI